MTPQQRPGGLSTLLFPIALFVFVAAALMVTGAWSLSNLPPAAPGRVGGAFPEQPWLDMWLRWDGAWYTRIAAEGYSFEPGVQSPVVFFPAYPMSMKILGPVFGDNPAAAGIFITLLMGGFGSVLFFYWCRRRLSPESSKFGTVALACYPFAYYLFGAIYADALLLAAALGAFLLLENDRPVLAGMAGAVASGTRLVGVAVALGLVILILQRREALSLSPFAIRPKRLRVSDYGVLLAPAGLLLYMSYLWARFDDPLAFATAAAAPGWDLAPGPSTWFKSEFLDQLLRLPPSMQHVRLGSYALLTVGALVLIPWIFRRFGLAYGVYTLVVVALPAISSKDFVGMGRYLLAAFPCFALLGYWLGRHRWVGIPVLTVSGCVLLLLTSLFARGFYLS